ncbi:general substrate transporter [Xylaria castorea]|nr:general substrate transporter [Xylaria castorea]
MVSPPLAYIMANDNTPSKLSEEAKLEGSSGQLDIHLEKHHGGSDTLYDVDSAMENYATIMATNKPDPRGPGYIRLYILAATIFLCSTMSGFDSSLMGSINALPNYIEYFGLPATGNASTGIVFAIFQVGQIAGALFVWLIDWYGRIWHIFFGCLGVIVGTVITALAPNLPTFIGGRFLLSFFATLTTTAAPLYLVEISPAAYRGTIAGSFNTFYYVGSILATSSVYGCHKHLADQGNLDWRIPLWLQAVCAGLVVLVIKFFPESPRYLILNDKHEEARQIIIKYHTNGDPNHPLVDLQMKESAEPFPSCFGNFQMIQSVQGIPKATWKDLFDLRVLVETRSSRYRLMLNMVFSWFAQFSGNNIISYYLPVMLDAIGVKDTDTKLILNIIYSAIGWVFSTCGARLHDVIGRRKMLMGSTFGMAICLAFVAAGSAGKIEYNNNAAATLSIVFIFAFGAVFSGAFTPMQPVYPAEVVSNRMRAKAMGAYKITSGAAGFLNTFVAPIALSSIGYWFYVFFVFWDTFEFAFIYFFFVETKGLTLEELDAIFEADNPRKASIQAKKKLQETYKLSAAADKTII